MRVTRVSWFVCFLLSSCTAQPAAPEKQQAAPVAPVVEAAAPPGPPKRLITHRFVVNVRTAPNRDAFRSGYLRAGSVFTATTNQPVGTDKCRKGWYEIAETGGFVCSGYDVVAFEGKKLPERRSRQPDLTARLPYPYAFTARDNTPLYRRLPSDEEAAIYEGFKLPAPVAAEGEVGVIAEAAPVAEAAETAELVQVAEAPSPLAATTVALAKAGASAANSNTVSADTDTGDEEDGPPTLASLKGERDSPLERRLVKGFYLSLDREMKRGSRKYWRTQSNGFVPYHSVREIEGADFKGTELSREPAVDPAAAGMRLPIGFVMSSQSFAYVLGKNGKPKRAKAPGYHFMFPIVDHVQVGRVAYDVAADGTYYRSDEITRIDAREPPAEIVGNDKWIDVDLARQSLVAYEGAVPVYATLVSTGRVKAWQDPLDDFATPTGHFRILSKHLTHTMDGDHAVDGPYSIEDVPYVMYFQLAYAIHAAFWHNSFGRTRSHGCINASPLDARWLFNWVTPNLPTGWHAAYPTEAKPGTHLYVRGEAPK